MAYGFTAIGVAQIIAWIVVVILAVDFLSGVFHWLEDSYARPETPVLGRFVVNPNIIHHHHPRDFVKSPFWHRNIVTAMLGGIVFVLAAATMGITWQLILLCGIGAFCNEFHCWAHRSAEENGAVITALHRLRILQTPRHHATHHTDPKNRAYCVLTNYTNPVLDSRGAGGGILLDLGGAGGETLEMLKRHH